MFKFTPYYNPSHPSWELMAISMSSLWKFCRCQKGCIYVAVRILLSALTYPQWNTRLPLVRLMQALRSYLI